MRPCMLPAFASGAVLGLLNLAHCAGMCGPLAAAGCKHAGRSGLLRYQLGRALAYGFAGAMCGHIGRALSLYTSLRWASWVFAALTAGACLFTARELLRRESAGLVPLRLRRSRSWLQTLFALLPRDPLALGLLSLLLPCGLLATALLAAVATGTAANGAAFMAAFAATSGSALLSASWLAQQLPRLSLSARRGLACLLVAGALVTIARPIAALPQASQKPSVGAPRCH